IVARHEVLERLHRVERGPIEQEVAVVILLAAYVVDAGLFGRELEGVVVDRACRAAETVWPVEGRSADGSALVDDRAGRWRRRWRHRVRPVGSEAAERLGVGHLGERERERLQVQVGTYHGAVDREGEAAQVG